ncbi:hypothetical protein [Streptomyces sp. x-19]|uniref:hypothetical protein n=1 Tax=Streptomyces sp. x-19 TaxID=2789280 RepID=UPI00397F1E29
MNNRQRSYHPSADEAIAMLNASPTPLTAWAAEDAVSKIIQRPISAGAVNRLLKDPSKAGTGLIGQQWWNRGADIFNNSLQTIHYWTPEAAAGANGRINRSEADSRRSNC